MSVDREMLKGLGLDEIQINAREAFDITNETLNGKNVIYHELSELTKNNLISHSREDAALAVLNTALIYKTIKSNYKNSRVCRIFIILLLIYIAVKVS